MIEADPGRRYVSRVTGDVIEATVEMLLRSDDETTEMTLRWTGRGTRFPVNLMLPLMRRRRIRQSQEELETFRELVETRGVDFGAV